MSFARPSLADLINRAYTDINSRIAGVDATLRRSNLNIFARVHSAVVNGLYGFIHYLAGELVYDTAVDFLPRWASIWGITPKPASFATGTATFTGVNGADIPALTELQRDDGALFTTNADATIAAGTAMVAITALAAGSLGVSSVGAAFITTLPINNVNAIATIVTYLDGADAEQISALRSRFIARVQQPPAGGNENDYENWALAVPGVTRAWCNPCGMGEGTVVVRFMMDLTYINGIPTTTDATTVYNYINTLRPAGMSGLFVVPPVAAPLNPAISIKPNNATVQAAITAQLAALILDEAQPEDGTGSGILLLSHVEESISTTVGVVDNQLTSLTANFAPAVGSIATLGTIAFSTLP